MAGQIRVRSFTARNRNHHSHRHRLYKSPIDHSTSSRHRSIKEQNKQQLQLPLGGLEEFSDYPGCPPSRRAFMGTAQAQRGPTHLDRVGTAQLAIAGFKQFCTRALYSNCAGQPMSNPRWPMPNPRYIDGVGIPWV